MQTDFAPLRTCLARCRAAGLQIPLWWRDDDATEATPELDRLLDLADKVTCPVHLAVIPEPAKPALADATAGRACHILVHGWRHADTSLPDQKKSEFGRMRPCIETELNQAHTRMRDLFGDRVWPLFVPPWNRITPALIASLPDAGFSAVSTFGPRKLHETVAGINTHIDPIFWRETRDLVPPERLVQDTVDRLSERLEGRADPSEPLGLLTHHLVHTSAIWEFTAVWLLEMLDGGAHVWHHDLKGDWP